MEELLLEISNFLRRFKEGSRIPFNKEALSPEFLEICDKIAELTGTWNPVELTTPEPAVLKREKEKFFAAFANGEDYQPKIYYENAVKKDTKEARHGLRVLLRRLAVLHPKNDQEKLFRPALSAKIDDDLATCDLIDGIKEENEEKIRRATQRKYPRSDAVTMAYARKRYEDLLRPEEALRVQGPPPLLTERQQKLLKSTVVKADQIKEAFEWVLNKYGILRSETVEIGFQVVITDRAAGIDVRDKGSMPMTIVIPTDRECTADKLLQLVAHEIEAHARQSINGIKMFRIGGGALKMDGEVPYEGLAKRLDESYRIRFFGVNTGAPEPWYALAIDMAERGASFAEIFRDQYDRRMHVALKVPADQQLVIDQTKHAKDMEDARNDAWTTTFRILRGHTDMSNALGYATTKDLSYLQGWLMDKQLVEAGFGGFNEMAILQSGGLEMLASLDVNVQDIPHPYQDLTKEYCFSALLPKLEAEQRQSEIQTGNTAGPPSTSALQ